MTGHRPDQAGNQNPSDSASQNAGADVSADEFAAALKLIVKRLDGQDDEAETPPAGRDSDSDLAAVPPTAALNTAPQPALSEPLWTGLSDSASGEPEAISPLAGGANASPDATPDSTLSDGGSTAGTTTAADLWPAGSPDDGGSPEDDGSTAGGGPTGPKDPLFLDTPPPGREPLFTESPAEPPPDREPLFAEQPPASPAAGQASSASAPGDDGPQAAPSPPAAAKEPLFVEPSSESGKEPLFADPPAAPKEPLFKDSPPGPTAKEPLFADTSSGGGDPLFASPPQAPSAKEPLFVETPSDPLLAEKPPPAESDPFKVQSSIGSGVFGQSESSAAGEHETSSDPLAALRNRDKAPTIGPAMPAPDPEPAQGATPTPEETSPPTMDTAAGGDPTGSLSGSAPGLDYPEPAGGISGISGTGAVEPPPAAEPETDPGDPFAAAARPAFEDDSANALFGDAPSLAEQHAPGSSLGPIGAEAENFEENGAGQQSEDAHFGKSAGPGGNGAPELTASRDLGEDGDSDVELDQILPPLDPEAGTLEKVASPPRPRRPLRVGAAAFWLLILAIFGGIGFWGYQTRDQAVALSAWAQDQYGLPGGQLTALLGLESGPADPIPPTEGSAEPSEPMSAMAAPEPAGEPVAQPQASPPAAMPEPAQPESASPAQPERPAPAATPAPSSPATAPVTVAAATPPRLPDHLAPLPSDVTPQIRALADRALAGDPLAQHDLANQYAVGHSVPQSNSYAAYWYGLASEAGIANAQYNLGVLTTRGLGVRKDVGRAFQLFQGAAEAGHADAQTALGLAYMHGLGVEQDRLQAASWFQSASTNGRPRGAFHLGQLFEEGLDEAPDLAAAAGWYRIAADAGYTQAREALERVTAAIRPAPAPTPTTRVAAPTTTPTPVPPSPAPILAQPSELVREIQRLLNQFGYNAGREDGRLGEQTVEAIRAFQRSQGLYATGEASTGLRDLLKVLAGAD